MEHGLTKYFAAAAVDQVLSAGPTRLVRIIVGADVSGGTIECSDSPTDGDGNVQVFLTSSTLKGVYEINADFPAGLTIDITGSQTHVTFVYRAVGSNT